MVRCSLYKSGAHPPWGPVDLIWSTILYPGGVHSTRAAASLGVSGREISGRFDTIDHMCPSVTITKHTSAYFQASSNLLRLFMNSISITAFHLFNRISSEDFSWDRYPVHFSVSQISTIITVRAKTSPYNGMHLT